MIDGYFSSVEFASKDGKPSPHGPMNVKPGLLILLNKIRAAYGKPIVVNSGYRSPEHNAEVGGVENSFHVQGLAADIRPLDKNKDDLLDLYMICNKLNPVGGVGYYDTFIHVDARGYGARWGSIKDGD